MGQVVPTTARATNIRGPEFSSYNVFDTTTSLTGLSVWNEWMSHVASNQKLNIAFDDPHVLSALVINNKHQSGTYTNSGANNAILYGTNSLTAYENTTYTDLTDLTALLTFTIREHVGTDTADPQTFAVPGSTAYQYYVFRLADNHGGTYLGLRQVDLYVNNPSYLKLDGVWEQPLAVKAKYQSAWKSVEDIYIKVNGVWTQ